MNFNYLIILLLSILSFSQPKIEYSFNSIQKGQIVNTNNNQKGKIFLIKNIKDTTYYLNIIQYDNDKMFSELVDFKNQKRIYFECNRKIEKIEDILHLKKSSSVTFIRKNTKKTTQDSIAIEIDSIKNELILRHMICNNNKILKDFIYIYSNSDLITDIQKKSIVKDPNLLYFIPNLKRFLNIKDNKIITEINYLKAETFTNSIILK